MPTDDKDIQDYRDMAMSLIKEYMPKVQESILYTVEKVGSCAADTYIKICDMMFTYSDLLQEDIEPTSARRNIGSISGFIRDAIIETYKLAFDIMLNRIDSEYNIAAIYGALIRSDRMVLLRRHDSAHYIQMINQIKQAKKLRMEANQKGKADLGTPQFEAAVSDLVKAYGILEELEPHMREMSIRLHERRFSRRYSILLTVIGIAVGIILTLIFTRC